MSIYQIFKNADFVMVEAMKFVTCEKVMLGFRPVKWHYLYESETDRFFGSLGFLSRKTFQKVFVYIKCNYVRSRTTKSNFFLKTPNPKMKLRKLKLLF